MPLEEITKKVKNLWEQLAYQYTGDKGLINFCWEELFKKYSEPERYYHNLDHLFTIISLIEARKGNLQNYHAVLFAAFYHDVIYDVSGGENEVKSAELAEKRLTELQVDSPIIALACKIIKQTATHTKTNNFDIDLFLDFDRCILASSEQDYEVYKQNIRKEYGIFSDSIYNYMRQKLLQKFLAQSEIYYTTILKNQETRARRNMEKELLELSGTNS